MAATLLSFRRFDGRAGRTRPTGRDEGGTGKSLIVCDLARSEIRHRESTQQFWRLELGFGHDEPVKFGLKLVNRHYDAL